MSTLKAVRPIRCFAVACTLALLAPGCCDAQEPKPARQVEDIIVARSWRESRIDPTAFCSRSDVGFGSIRFEDEYSFRSVATRAADGRIVDANVRTIGRLHACIGSTPDSVRLNFYAEGILADVTFTGRGECITAKQNFPESGMSVMRCFLDISKLPAGYVGGQLTTNTVGSRAVLGGASDPSGYTQPSIATIRLWKRR